MAPVGTNCVFTLTFYHISAGFAGLIFLIKSASIVQGVLISFSKWDSFVSLLDVYNCVCFEQLWLLFVVDNLFCLQNNRCEDFIGPVCEKNLTMQC